MVTTKYGKYLEVDHGDYLEYRRVPYAKAPVGDLRFKAPVKCDLNDGVVNSIDYPPVCIQKINYDIPPWNKDFFSNDEFIRPSDEDCLYLNIWTPVDYKEKAYPVAIWIHGGAFINGYATELEFDGAAYARRDVILVSVEYRCNIFGFLAHPWLTKENERAISGNYGILDQIMAIDFVKENIMAFGGDPNNITVFGQSAGAASVQVLVSSPLAKGRINKAILMSGGAYKSGIISNISLGELEEYGVRLVNSIGVNSLEELRRIKPMELYERMEPEYDRIVQERGDFFLMPACDGYLITDDYDVMIDKGMLEDIPYMTGWTKDDFDVMGDERAQGIPNNNETIVKTGCIEFAEQAKKSIESKVYLYSFDRNLPGDNWGAYHSSELCYVFGTLDRTWRPWEESDYLLSTRMIDDWTDFMKTGSPKWEAYDSNRHIESYK